ncbi:unnamed protein product [Calypogeia fissa]
MALLRTAICRGRNSWRREIFSSPVQIFRSFYQAFWEAIPFMSVENESTALQDSNAVVTEDTKSGEHPVGVTKSNEEKTEEEKTHGDKAEEKAWKEERDCEQFHRGSASRSV